MQLGKKLSEAVKLGTSLKDALRGCYDSKSSAARDFK